MSRPPRGRYFSLWNEPWFNMPTPSRLFDPQFGMGVGDDEYYSPGNYRGAMVVHRYMRPRRQTEVVNDENTFVVRLDVQHFAPDEIDVKTLDNHVVVHAKHRETEDEHGFICREFTRKYDLPQDVNPITVTSSISSGGVLCIKAPKMARQPNEEQNISVIHETPI